MSTNMEQPTTTPKRARNRPPRKEGPRTLQQGIGDVIVTPNSKRNHHIPRTAPQDIPNNNIMSAPPLPDQVIPSIEGLDLGSDPTPSTQKKKRHHKKKTGERNQPEQINIFPQSPPTEYSALQATPSKTIQMYAGPTFHASPAPSSLPMPKFFSQAMRSERASEPIQMPSDGSSDESSSHHGGDSPTLRNSLRAIGNSHTREASPLDIFFNADRQEKAQKARLGSNLAHDRAKSASPARDAFRSPTQPVLAQPAFSGDDNYAKTQALKLLLFPEGQVTDNSSISQFLDIHRPATTRSTSESSTPTRLTINSNGSPFEKRSFYDSPNLSTTPSSARPRQNRRPLPHHLRQEFLNSLPLDQSPDVSTKSVSYAPIPRA